MVQGTDRAARGLGLENNPLSFGLTKKNPLARGLVKTANQKFADRKPELKKISTAVVTIGTSVTGLAREIANSLAPAYDAKSNSISLDNLADDSKLIQILRDAFPNPGTYKIRVRVPDTYFDYSKQQVVYENNNGEDTIKQIAKPHSHLVNVQVDEEGNIKLRFTDDESKIIIPENISDDLGSNFGNNSFELEIKKK